ncbi:MAG: hypothetical protein U0L55_00605 [Acutalibacteraceae bacterium]|nr:hypothetical protein [Acutalibacteraceae bacterium]
MLKRLIVAITLVAVLFVLPAATPIKVNVTDTKVEVEATVYEVDKSNADIKANIMKARFENMLNNNFLYGDDFVSHKVIIENSILALLDKGEDGEIDKALVLGFIADMYGLQVDPSAAEYDFAPASEGKFLILPRGYTEYKHTVTSVSENEGGYTVNSDVVVMTHDGEEYKTTASTVIVPNEGSSFGYNIVSSVIE